MKLRCVQGQALTEFLGTAAICGVAAVLGILLFHDAFRRHECARMVFQSTRFALNFAHMKSIPPFTSTGVFFDRDETSLWGEKICGRRTESVRLGKIPQRTATILDPRVFHSFFSSSSSEREP